MTRHEFEIRHSVMEEFRANKKDRYNYEAVINLLKALNLGAAIAFIISFI